ncbi:MAG: hypothetical protein M3Y56_07095 [Armatimonadota bacterium]|nr:hypothetical protein [Armatimonadota bacterium]
MTQCEACSVEMEEAEAEEFMGCDDGDLILCKPCSDAAWKIPGMFGGSFGLPKTRAVTLIRNHRDLDAQ